MLIMYFYIRHKTRLHRIPIESVCTFCSVHGIETENITPKEIHEVISSVANDGLKEMDSIVRLDTTNIYMTILRKACICGESDSIFVEDSLINDRCCYLSRNAINVPDYCIGISSDSKIALSRNIVPTTKIKKGIFLLGRWPNNWWHLTYENLSRLQYYDLYEKYRDWPIIVDEVVWSVEANRKLLESINILDRKVILLKKNEIWEVEQLLYASCPVIEQVNNNGYPQISSVRDNITYIRKCVIEKQIGIPDATRKIFVVRGKNDRLVNEMDLIPIFQRHGFETVCMDNMSFEEEVFTFASAKCLVSTLGGAMTNLMYCSPKASVVCIYPTEDASPVEFYQNVASSVGFKLLLCDARLQSVNKEYDRIEYSLDEEDCEKLITCLLERT